MIVIGKYFCNIFKKTFMFEEDELFLCIVYFVLHAISPCTTGLKATFDPTQLHKCSPSSQVTDIHLTERESLMDDHLSMSLRFFILPHWIGPNDRGPPFDVTIQATMYLCVPGFEPTTSAFLK